MKFLRKFLQKLLSSRNLLHEPPRIFLYYVAEMVEFCSRLEESMRNFIMRRESKTKY